MKRTTVVSIFALLAVGTASAQAFDLGWNTIDGGGDMWTAGGAFELSGTIGQSDAGPVVMTGGGFELTGGFWAGAPARYPGDLNCDGLVNNGDIDAFVLALTDPAGYAAAYPSCDVFAADVNGDGLVNNGDIDAFVALLTGG
jgi:hypothetical protein